MPLSVTRMFAAHVVPPAGKRDEYTFQACDRRSAHTATASPVVFTAIRGESCAARPELSSLTLTFVLQTPVLALRWEKKMLTSGFLIVPWRRSCQTAYALLLASSAIDAFH